jgi:sugar-specific transcriptional regulator TrmB
MDSTLARLEKLGLSSYESKAMVALLKKHPSNGYQVGKIAGIPIFDESVTPAQFAGVLKSASKTAMVSVWPKEHTRFRPDIRAAESRGVKVVLSLFGTARAQGRFAIRMSGCGETSRKRLGARLMVIAADSKAVVISSIADADETVGIVTSTPQIVRIAKEYIRHDVWSRILIDEIGEEKFNRLCRQNELMSFLIANE